MKTNIISPQNSPEYIDTPKPSPNKSSPYSAINSPNPNNSSKNLFNLRELGLKHYSEIKQENPESLETNHQVKDNSDTLETNNQILRDKSMIFTKNASEHIFSKNASKLKYTQNATYKHSKAGNSKRQDGEDRDSHEQRQRTRRETSTTNRDNNTQWTTLSWQETENRITSPELTELLNLV